MLFPPVVPLANSRQQLFWKKIICILLFHKHRTFPSTNATSSQWHKDASSAFAEVSPSMLSPINRQNTFQGHSSVLTLPTDTGELANVTGFN